MKYWILLLSVFTHVPIIMSCTLRVDIYLSSSTYCCDLCLVQLLFCSFILTRQNLRTKMLEYFGIL